MMYCDVMMFIFIIFDFRTKLKIGVCSFWSRHVVFVISADNTDSCDMKYPGESASHSSLVHFHVKRVTHSSELVFSPSSEILIVTPLVYSVWSEVKRIRTKVGKATFQPDEGTDALIRWLPEHFVYSFVSRRTTTKSPDLP